MARTAGDCEVAEAALAFIADLEKRDVQWHELALSYYQSVCKLDRCIGALENLLPGLILDLRYADPDDDRDAMQSRIKTVTDALEATK